MYIIDKYNNFFEKIYNYYIVISKEDSKKIQINRKKEHSYRVRENSLVIAESLNLNKKDLFMVNIISLFHDIGRAKQFYIYNTYVDSNSKNHALIGIDIIKNLIY
jgi:HD-GYP domain-containing protein (c-di-GMP phosphodiesterase class II)